MAINSSSTAGVLLPNTPYPLDDDALDMLLQSLVTQITGLDTNFVRPRWQSVSAKEPAIGADWCAISVLDSEADAGPTIGYGPDGNVGTYTRHETLSVVATFYGPNSKSFAAILRDGLAIPQNTDVLRDNAMAYVSCGRIINAPELLNQVWQKRHDISITIRRQIVRSYNIEYLEIAELNLIDDTVVNDVIVVPPGSTLEP